MRNHENWLPVIRQFSDRGFQWLLEAPQNARGLMTVIAEEVAACLDFSRMQREPPNVIAEDLRQRTSDLILRVPYRHSE